MCFQAFRVTIVSAGATAAEFLSVQEKAVDVRTNRGLVAP
mgnify:CR=1 FL=1